VRIDIYNIKGQLVKTLVNELKEPGRYSVIWNGDDNQANKVASGIYFYRLITDGYNSTKKMLLMK
jgi:flagellar hook assembly protein FlgD